MKTPSLWIAAGVGQHLACEEVGVRYKDLQATVEADPDFGDRIKEIKGMMYKDGKNNPA